MIILSVIESVAINFSLLSNDLFSVKQICEELIREILESSYVDNKNKKEYICYLKKNIENENTHVILNNTDFEPKREQLNNKFENTYNLLSLFMVSIALCISIFVTIFSDSQYKFFYTISEPLKIGMLIVIAELGMMLPMFII